MKKSVSKFTRTGFTCLALLAGAAAVSAEVQTATAANAGGTKAKKLSAQAKALQKRMAKVYKPSVDAKKRRDLADFLSGGLLVGGGSFRSALLPESILPSATVLTSGTLTPTTTTYSYSTAPWVLSTGDGPYPDLGGTATINAFLGSTPGTVATATTITVDVSPTLSQITYNSPFSVGFAAGTSTSIVAASSGLTLNAQLSGANTPTLFQLTNTFASPISGGGSAGLTKTGVGTVNLTGANTYTGGTHINGGLLEIGSTAAVGDSVFGDATGGISFNGGSLFTNVTGGLTDARAVFLDTGGATIYTNTAATFNGVISGPGSLTNAGFAAVVLTLGGANTYTGATIDLQNVSSTTLSGNGSITTTSRLDLTGTFTLTNTGTNVLDRVSDTAPVAIRGVNFISTGNATATSSETIGAVTAISSLSTFLVTPGTTAADSLTVASLTRQNNSLVFLRGTGLGGTPGNTVANIYSTTAPTLTGGSGTAGTTTISILPWALGNNTNSVLLTAAGQIGSGFVTYGANGFRTLDPTTEYATAFGVNNTDNVRITAATAVAAPVTANAVLLAPATAAASALSGGPITITSGAFMYSPTANVTGTVSAGLNFGTTEGIITNTSTLNLSSVITGSGGVTFATGASATPSTATIALSGASTYTGNTVLNSGSLGFSGTVAAAGSASVFGNSGTIVLAGGVNFASLAATAAATLNRDISSIGTGTNYIANGSGFTFTLNGNISLTNNLYIYGNSNAVASAITFNGTISGAGGVIDTTFGYDVFNGNNTFTGGVTLPATSTFVAGSDTAFGTGPIYVTGAGTIIGAGTTARTLANPLFLTSTTAATIGGTAPLTFTGSVNLNGSRTLSVTNTASTVFSGVVSNGSFTKTGAGALTFASPSGNTYTGGTNITTGSLLINNTSGSATGTGAVNVTGAGRIFGGTGFVSGATSVATNSILQAGLGAPSGTLTLSNNLTLVGGSIIQLYVASSGAHSTLARTGGTWTLPNAIAFALYGATSNTFYDNIITGLAADPGTESTWTFSNNGGAVGTFTYDGTGNIDLTLTTVPEPATVLGGVFTAGLLGLGVRRRMRALAVKRAA